MRLKNSRSELANPTLTMVPKLVKAAETKRQSMWQAA
jgi:hypothetical protein